MSEIAWPHIELVYELFFACLESSHFRVEYAKSFLDSKFIRQLIRLFESEDTRERNCLKTILHKIYSIMVPLRAQIRSEISNVLLNFVEEDQCHHGIIDILSFLTCIIDGFMVPLKAEHRLFFLRTLISLYRSRYFKSFYPMLNQCVVQFINKDANLIQPLFTTILRYWPRDQTDKQVFLMKSIGALLPSVPVHQFLEIEVPLFRHIARCIGGDHFMIAEMTLSLFNLNEMTLFVADNIQFVMPVLFGPLQSSSRHHWHQRTSAMCASILQLFAEIDPIRFQICLDLYNRDPGLSEISRWRRLEELAIQWKQESEQQNYYQNQQHN
jgi:serine/threonine-protein phosphatase 2A regulatory subunit B'